MESVKKAIHNICVSSCEHFTTSLYFPLYYHKMKIKIIYYDNIKREWMDRKVEGKRMFKIIMGLERSVYSILLERDRIMI